MNTNNWGIAKQIAQTSRKRTKEKLQKFVKEKKKKLLK
jgi:hypothetical protein